jgi:hypothetical protein
MWRGKGGASSTVTVHNGPVTVDADSTVEVVGLNDIKITAKLEPTPLKTEAKQELILPQPLKTESKVDTKADVTSDSKSAMAIDLKPVAMDVCLSSTSNLPHGQIHQPFNLHLGLTWFGVEFFGVNSAASHARSAGSSEETGDRPALSRTLRPRPADMRTTIAPPAREPGLVRIIETAMAQAGDRKSLLMPDARSRSSWWPAT